MQHLSSTYFVGIPKVRFQEKEKRKHIKRKKWFAHDMSSFRPNNTAVINFPSTQLRSRLFSIGQHDVPKAVAAASAAAQDAKTKSAQAVRARAATASSTTTSLATTMPLAADLTAADAVTKAAAAVAMAASTKTMQNAAEKLVQEYIDGKTLRLRAAAEAYQKDQEAGADTARSDAEAAVAASLKALWVGPLSEREADAAAAAEKLVQEYIHGPLRDHLSAAARAAAKAKKAEAVSSLRLAADDAAAKAAAAVAMAASTKTIQKAAEKLVEEYIHGDSIIDVLWKGDKRVPNIPCCDLVKGCDSTSSKSVVVNPETIGRHLRNLFASIHNSTEDKFLCEIGKFELKDDKTTFRFNGTLSEKIMVDELEKWASWTDSSFKQDNGIVKRMLKEELAIQDENTFEIQDVSLENKDTYCFRSSKGNMDVLEPTVRSLYHNLPFQLKLKEILSDTYYYDKGVGWRIRVCGKGKDAPLVAVYEPAVGSKTAKWNIFAWVPFFNTKQDTTWSKSSYWKTEHGRYQMKQACEGVLDKAAKAQIKEIFTTFRENADAKNTNAKDADAEDADAAAAGVADGGGGDVIAAHAPPVDEVGAMTETMDALMTKMDAFTEYINTKLGAMAVHLEPLFNDKKLTESFVNTNPRNG